MTKETAKKIAMVKERFGNKSFREFDFYEFCRKEDICFTLKTLRKYCEVEVTIPVEEENEDKDYYEYDDDYFSFNSFYDIRYRIIE